MKIYIPKRVESDFSFISNTFVEPGIYEAKLNPQGAVSVITKDGTSLGIKLDEFLFLSKMDQESWLNIAHPNIPEIKENDEIKSSEKFTNLGEYFQQKKNELKKMNPIYEYVVNEIQINIATFLQRMITEYKSERNFEKRSNYSYPELTAIMFAFEDLGKGILPTHDHKKTRLNKN